MTDNDKTRFSDALSLLQVAQGAKPDRAIVPAYWEFLKDLELDDFLRACQAAGRTMKWFPKPSEIRDLSGQSTEAKSAAAWEAVRTAMDRHDYTTSVDFGPLVNAVVRNLGGWLWLCDQKATALPFVRKDFERVYGMLALSEASALHGEPLRGQFGGPVVRVAIGGERPMAALPPVRSEGEARVIQLVRDLADRPVP